MIIFKTVITILISLLLFIGFAIVIPLLCAGLCRICLGIFEWIEKMIYRRNKHYIDQWEHIEPVELDWRNK